MDKDETIDILKSSVMLNEPVFKTYLHYSIPWMLGMLLLSSAGLVDGIFIGRYVGATALAAINLIVPLYSLLLGLGIMCASGGAVCVAHYLGKNDLKNAQAMFTKSLIALTATSLVVALLILVFASEIIGFMGATGQLAEEAHTYLVAITIFSPTIMFSMGLSYFVRVDERPRLASLGLMCTAVNNVILDYIFIVVLNWGILGAAVGTGLAGIATVFILGAHFFSKKAKLRQTSDFGSWTEVLHAYWNGLSEFINEASVGLIIFLINLLVLRELGENGVAAFTIINYTSWLVLTISFGLSDPLAPLVSINHTAGKNKRVNSFVSTAMFIILGVGLGAVLICTLAPEILVSIFLPGNLVVSGLLINFITIYKWSFLFTGPNMAITTILTGYRLAGQSVLVAAMRGLLLPVLLLGILPRIFGLEGVYMAIPVAEATTFLLAIFLFWRAKNSQASAPKKL